MGQKRIPGLYKARGTWHIDKIINGRRFYENTGTSSLEEAEKHLAKRIEDMRQARVFGIRPQRSFRDAAIKFLRENQHKSSICDDAMHLRQLNPYIGNLNLEQVHIGALQKFIADRRKQGRKTKTINHALSVVRHILNLAASEWIDENGLTWLAHAPKIKMLPIRDARVPHPLTRTQQEDLFKILPLHLRQMALFKVNTGCREQEVCQLKWEWEVQIPILNTSVFIIPAFILTGNQYKSLVKNGEDRLVVLNDIAKSVIEEVRGEHPKFVFTYEYNFGKRRPVTCMNNTAWKKARKKIGLEQVRIHDLKHTFGERLRAADVSFEDRQDLLGHKSEKITTHYSTARVRNLIVAANKACQKHDQGPSTLMLLRNTGASSQRFPSSKRDANLKELVVIE